MPGHVMRALPSNVIAQMARAAAAIAEGDRYFKLPFLDHGGAAGDLARAVERLRLALIEADGAVAEQEADGENQAQRRASTECFIARFETAADSVQRSLADAAQSMKAASGALARQASDVSERSGEVNMAAANASREVSALAGATGQLDQSLADLERRVRRAAGVVGNAVFLVEDANKTIRGLSEAADRIGGMAHVIADIAGQTRMLALNATIEAARAGEAGKGFSVVAAEVKNLVGGTETATTEIDDRAREILQAAGAAIDSMAAIGREMAEINELVAAVAAAMHQQSAASATISAGVQTTAAEATSVTEAISRVAALAGETRNEAMGLREASESVAGQSETLRQAVGNFLADLDHGAIRIGILHSLSGSSAVGERPLKDVLRMEAAALNAKGGLLGRPVEAIVYNPRSEAGRYAELAEQALTRDRVAALFGAWSSTSRKAMLPVLARHRGLLFYPSQYEGAEADPHVVYCGAPPNQQLLPAIAHLMSEQGGGYGRFFLVGSDTLYPRMTHKALKDYLAGRGVPDSAIRETLKPVGASDWSSAVREIRAFSRQEGAKVLVVSTIGGDSNFYFFREAAGIETRILTVSIGEAELIEMDPALLAGHLVAWNYLMSQETPENEEFLREIRAFTGRPDQVANDAMEASLLAFRLWAKAVEAAGTTDQSAVRAALGGLAVRSPSGFDVFVDKRNGHLHKPAVIGRVQKDGRIEIVWRSAGLIAPEIALPAAPTAMAAE